MFDLIDGVSMFKGGRFALDIKCLFGMRFKKLNFWKKSKKPKGSSIINNNKESLLLLLLSFEESCFRL